MAVRSSSACPLAAPGCHRGSSAAVRVSSAPTACAACMASSASFPEGGEPAPPASDPGLYRARGPRIVRYRPRAVSATEGREVEPGGFDACAEDRIGLRIEVYGRED